MRIEVAGLTKRFGATTALSEVGFSVAPGERLAVLGENGAGKSTLMKILMGVYSADTGTMRLNGEYYAPASPRSALAAGVSIVYQEPSFFPHLSVLENFFVGREQISRGGNLAWPVMRKAAAEAFGQLGIDESLLSRKMGTLSLAEQQMVLIARAVDVDCQVLILDEPTSILTANEAERLFGTVQQLAGCGVTILYITHRLDEIPQVADRVVILRDGALVADIGVDQAVQDLIVSKMSGRKVERVAQRAGKAGRDVLLSVRGLTRPGEFTEVDLTICAGEVVGLYGLVGSGRTEVALTLFGDRQPAAGKMTLAGAPYAPRSPEHAISRGVAYLPEDRKTQGNFRYMTTGQNLASASLKRESNSFGVLNSSRLRAVVRTGIETLKIKAPTPEFPILGLSGGHQQKTLFARWLATKPELLLLDEPTRGIDVGTKAEIHAEILRLADQGVGVLIISSELPELLAVSDRIDVLRQGRVVASLSGEEMNENAILMATLGIHEQKEVS